MGQVIAVGGHTPTINPGAFLAATSLVAGNVTVEADASVWFGTVVRSEYEPVTIGAGSNLQDLTTVHADPGFPVRVGQRVTVGHRCILHGCTIEDDALIGMGAVVMNGAVVGEGAVVGAGAVVTEGTHIPPKSLAVGIPARVLEGKPVPGVPRPNVAAYQHFAELYAEATGAGEG